MVTPRSRPFLGHFHVNLRTYPINHINSQVYSQFFHWSNTASLIPLILWYCQDQVKTLFRSFPCQLKNISDSSITTISLQSVLSMVVINYVIIDLFGSLILSSKAQVKTLPGSIVLKSGYDMTGLKSGYDLIYGSAWLSMSTYDHMWLIISSVIDNPQCQHYHWSELNLYL